MKKNVIAAVALVAGCIQAATLVPGSSPAPAGSVVEVGPVEGNATPAVRAAVARLKDGDTLRFAKGEYHFFEEGAKEHFLASVGSSTGMKKVVVHLEGLKDVTVDGGGASFVFHGDSFPFVVERCDGVKIGNFTSRVFRLPLVEFTIAEKNDEGFLCQFAKGSAPYETKDGEIFFDMDEGRTDSREREISVHALRYCHIQYITTPKCKRNKDTLASTFYPVAAEDRGGGKVFFRYFKDAHPKNAGKCSFPLNEPLCLLVREHQDRAVQRAPGRGVARLAHGGFHLSRRHEGAHRDRGIRNLLGPRRRDEHPRQLHDSPQDRGTARGAWHPEVQLHGLLPVPRGREGGVLARQGNGEAGAGSSRRCGVPEAWA